MNIPNNIRLSHSAAKELKKLGKKDPRKFKRVLEDIIRLGSGTLPPQGRKKLKTIAAYQFDCGNFRVVYEVRESLFFILDVFKKPEQKRKLKNL